jgi:dGTPase
MRAQVTKVVQDLFALFLSRPDLLPGEWRKDVEQANDQTRLVRIVADYIAGMTDRFALETHARLIGGEG